jgi:tRNA pseudouridine13 synthase
MKLKQHPDDFQVEEVTSVRPGTEGAFALYRLRKRGWSTPDALAVVRRRWGLAPRRLSYGGLKDRHAATAQFFTVFHGPRRNLRQEGLDVAYLGQVPGPFTSAHIDANRFRLTLRDVDPAGQEAIGEELARIARDGLPNYYDDQRFGSVGPDGTFIARLLIAGDFEAALRLALTGPYEYDRAAQKQEKALLRQRWGDWPWLRGHLSRGQARTVAGHLSARPEDYKGAFLRLPTDLRALYLAAYQSHLWNQVLAGWLRAHCPPERLRTLPHRLGPLPLHTALPEGLASLSLPLPSARHRPSPGDPAGPFLDAVLAAEGLALRDLRVKGVRELFFSRGERAALCFPRALAHAFADDDRHPGRSALSVSFALPRGSYATLLAKAVGWGGE